jgi:soluble lytic murein transglycosylase-like protein
LPPEFVASVAAAESGYRTDAISGKGAVGLMQLMPATADLLGTDPNDPAENADAGARYLRELLLKYGYSAPLALAAYNAGPGAVDRYGDIPPYPETRAYVQRVLRQFQQNRK